MCVLVWFVLEPQLRQRVSFFLRMPVSLDDCLGSSVMSRSLWAARLCPSLPLWSLENILCECNPKGQAKIVPLHSLLRGVSSAPALLTYQDTQGHPKRGTTAILIWGYSWLHQIMCICVYGLDRFKYVSVNRMSVLIDFGHCFSFFVSDWFGLLSGPYVYELIFKFFEYKSFFFSASQYLRCIERKCSPHHCCLTSGSAHLNRPVIYRVACPETPLSLAP